jgi:hypothetical protein
MKKTQDFAIGDKVKCINDKGIPDFVREMGVTKGKTFTIRSIGEKDFTGKGGGLRFQGIILYSDMTGYEKCFGRERFVVTKKKTK